MKWIALSSEHHLRNRCIWFCSKHIGCNWMQEVVIKGPHNNKIIKSNVTCQNYTPIQLQQCHVLMIHCDSVKASSRGVAYIYIYSCCSFYGGNKKLLSTHPHECTHARTHTHTCMHAHTHTCMHTHTHTHTCSNKNPTTANKKYEILALWWQMLPATTRQQLNYFCMTVTPNVCNHNTH